MSQSCDELKATLAGAPERKSGRAVFDEGRTVWEWQTATGVFERFVSDEQLSRLEASDLQLLDQTSQTAGSAIYCSKPSAHAPLATERVFVPRREAAPVARSAPSEARSALRQLLHRLVHSI